MRQLYFLCAVLVLAAGCKKLPPSDNGNDPSGEHITWPTQAAMPVVSGAARFDLDAADEYVNVMEDAMPRMPNYPRLNKRELIMRGFVADLAGTPLKDAYIGLRSAGSVYIAASATTDENGYYEMNIPLGGADIYAAGYVIDYGTGGRAALSLYPTDGSTNLTSPGAGVVKNFVLLSYGLADVEERASKPWSSGGYFGGSLRFDYSLYDDLWTPHGLPEGAEVELHIRPEEGTTLYGESKSFTLVKKIGDGNGNFVVNNIPIGKYTITARLKGGGALKMKQTGPYVSTYPNQGLQPKTATGTASVWFTPMGVEARSPNANFGYWRPVSITLEQP